MSFINKKLVEFNEYLQEKKIAIIGVDYNNVKLIEYLYNIQADDIVVFDKREIEYINGDLMDKVITRGIEYRLGENCLNSLEGFNIIFRSPDYLPIIPQIVAEEQRGTIITSYIGIFIELCPSKVIGITGTDGKLTTSALIYEILKNAGYNCYIGGDEKTFLLNNLEDMTPEDFVILQLNNKQLFNMKTSPDISIITNIELSDIETEYEDEEYINAVKSIFLNQNENGLLILNYDNEIIRSFEEEAKGKVVFFGEDNINEGYLISDNKIKVCNGDLRIHLLDSKNMILRGAHNLKNSACAIIATSEFVDLENSLISIKNFTDMENRLEFILETENRIKWYNDSASIKPSRIITSLDAFALRNIVLIASGENQKADYNKLAKSIINSCKVLILTGENVELLEEAINNQLKNTGNKISIYRDNNIESCIKKAKEVAGTGDVVLFSPGADCLEGYKERGKKFKELVNKIYE